MNFIKEINKVRDQVFSCKWKNYKNAGNFFLALSVARRIKLCDETGEEDEQIVLDLVELANGYGFKVIKKRETNGTWEG